MKSPFTGDITSGNRLAYGISLLLILFSFSGLNAADKVNINRNYQVVEAENKVWIATPNGLFQYNSDDDSYKRYIIPGNPNSQAVREIEYNDEWIWCVMDSSLAAMHIRLNEWLIFNEKTGLPSNRVTGIDFTDDYIYISTDKGAARYDLLIEEWENLANEELNGKPVRDVIVIDDVVWFFTDHSASEYSPGYEKWRHQEISSDPELRISMAYYFNKRIWLISNQGLVQFNPELRSFQFHTHPYLQPGSILEIFTEDENNWIIANQGLYMFGYESEMWNEFEANAYLENKHIVNGYVDDSEVWIFTDRDVHVYDRDEKDWQVLDYVSGLTSTAFLTGYISGGMAFLINEQSIEHRLTEEDNWYFYEIKQYGDDGGLAGKKILKNLFDNEAGGYIPLGSKKWSWEGTRMTYIYDLENTFPNSGSTLTDLTSGFRLDVKSQFAITENRTISGYFNNIDYSETMYGVRYRSKENDLLREFNWGDYRHEPGLVPFGETASMFGSNIWLQAGKKTEKYKRSLFTVKAQTGQKRSQKHYEYSLGVLDEFSFSLEASDYQAYRFYSIPYFDTTQIVSDIEIYADDNSSGNNTPNTETVSIAGVSGNFDLLKATSDYYYYEKANVIRFTGYYNSSATLVIRFQVNGTQYEGILQQDSTISTSLENFYYLNASSIVPYSFKLEIEDELGADISLSDMGLDDNGDGRVDSEWIDYENGILILPEDRTVLGDFTMQAEYDTEYALMQLEYDNLVREKETVKLDGIPAEAGTDYVLDYTNGTLVFVKDGLVSPETQIEVEYEYYVSDDYSQMHGATVNFSPSDNISVQADWVNFENENDSTSNLLTLSSELRQKAGDFDIKITPGVAFDAEENKITAYQAEGVVSSSKIRFQSKYENYKEEYQNIYEPQSMVGKVKEKFEMNTDIDVHKNVRLSGTWNDTKSFETEFSDDNPYYKTRSAGALFHHQSLPGYEITYNNSQIQTDTSSIQKSYLQQQLEYQVPQNVLDKIRIKSLKLEGNLKSGSQSGQEIAGTMNQKFVQGNFRVNMSLANQFQTSLFYRRNDFTDNDSESSSEKKHVLTSERVLFNLSHEKWSLLQTNLRIENSMESYDYPSDDEYDLDLSQYTQLNFRLSPGALWDKLSSLFFEFNINQSLYATGNSDESSSKYIWSALPVESDEMNNAQYLRTYYIKNEFRPNPKIYLYSLYEWNNQKTQYSLSDLYTNYWRLSEKLDLKLGNRTRLNLQYKQYYSDLGYDELTSYLEPSVWLERRWTSSFQNVFYGSYRYTKDFEGDIKDYIHKYEARYDIIFKKKDYLRMDRLELQQSFSGGQTITDGYNADNYYYLNSTTSLNIYPLQSLIIRLNFGLNKVTNIQSPDDGYLSTDLNLRLSLKF